MKPSWCIFHNLKTIGLSPTIWTISHAFFFAHMNHYFCSFPYYHPLFVGPIVTFFRQRHEQFFKLIRWERIPLPLSFITQAQDSNQRNLVGLMVPKAFMISILSSKFSFEIVVPNFSGTNVPGLTSTKSPFNGNVLVRLESVRG